MFVEVTEVGEVAEVLRLETRKKEQIKIFANKITVNDIFESSQGYDLSLSIPFIVFNFLRMKKIL